MIPVIHKLQAEGYSIVQVDVDEQPDLTRRLNVRMYPTFIRIENGQEVERIEGVTSEAKLRQFAPNASQMAQNSPPATNSNGMNQPQRSQNSPKNFVQNSSAGQSIGMSTTGYERAYLGQPNDPTANDNTTASNVQPQLPAQQPINLPSVQPVANTQLVSNTQPVAKNYNLAYTEQTPAANYDADAFSGNSNKNKNAPVIRAQMDDRQAGQQAEPASKDVMMAATVKIRIREKNGINFGTGTIIDSKSGRALILTCGHILRDLKPQDKIEIDFYTAKGPVTLVGSPVAANHDADVGLVSVPSDLVFQTVKVAPALDQVRKEQKVISIGCSSGQDPTREEVVVTATNKYLGPDNVECTGTPVRGRSGGGLFDEQGRVVGVCSAADPQEKRGLYCGLKPILTILAEQGLDHLIPEGSAGSTSSAVAMNAPKSSEQDIVNNILNQDFSSELKTQNLNANTSAPNVTPVSAPFGNMTNPVAMNAGNTNAASASGYTVPLDSAVGARLTIVIEVPGHPEQTRTVIVPVATQKLIQDLTGQNTTANDQMAGRKSLLPTEYVEQSTISQPQKPMESRLAPQSTASDLNDPFAQQLSGNSSTMPSSAPMTGKWSDLPAKRTDASNQNAPQVGGNDFERYRRQ
jgi:hypothetical protein